MSRSRCRRIVMIGLLAVVMGLPAAVRPARAERHALLIGCGNYPALQQRRQLQGPANDVVLMRRTLLERFGFDGKNIVTLTDRADSRDYVPTAAAIRREFERLAARVRKGDEVVVYLAGHGSQQPDDDPENPRDYEPDGLDEIFLPSDVQAWDGRRGAVVNAIRDDQLRGWIDEIRASGAFVWAIVDSCHAGSGLRGAETTRAIPPDELLLPDEVLQRALERTSRRDDWPIESNGTIDGGDEPAGFVALYAVQPHQLASESMLPRRGSDRRRHGVFTYTLNQVLLQAERPLTYGELVERVYRSYVSGGRGHMVPMLEGGHHRRLVLGGMQDRIRGYRLSADRQGRLTIDGGQLHGLTTGSILQVLSPDDTVNNAAPAGYVKVTQLGSLRSVVQPSEYHGRPAGVTLADGSRCRVVFVDYGDNRLRLAIETAPAADAAIRERTRRLTEDVRRLSRDGQGLFVLAQELSDAQWLIRPVADNFYLVPAAGLSSSNRTGNGRSISDSIARLYGPIPEDETRVEWLRDRLHRIARCENLLALGSIASAGDSPATDSPDGRGVHIEVDVVWFPQDSDRPAEAIAWQRDGRTLEVGQRVAFRVRNRSKSAIYASLLFVDSHYGIHAYFPRAGVRGENRVAAGESLTTSPTTVSASTLGVEHMVVLAIPASGLPVDFSVLQQPTINAARSLSPGSAKLGDSTLGRLLENSLYPTGKTRAMPVESIVDYCVRVVSWRVIQP